VHSTCIEALKIFGLDEVPKVEDLRCGERGDMVSYRWGFMDMI